MQAHEKHSFNKRPAMSSRVELYLIGRAAVSLLRFAIVSLWVLVLSVLIAACGAQMPKSLNLPDVRALGIVQAQSGVGIGERIRWGGTISGVVVRQDETCLQIVGRPLDERARPRLVDRSDGRFWACSQGLLDPEIYARGRSVTVVGRLTEMREGIIGERALSFPRCPSRGNGAMAENATRAGALHCPWLVLVASLVLGPTVRPR